MLRDEFLALHVPGDPLLIPNPWDAGSAKILAALGFRALATTSSGYAATLGRRDYGITRDEAVGHAAGIVAATPLPVSADLENGFGDDLEAVAETVRRAVGVGLAGCSIEDSTGRPDDPVYDTARAVERVRVAVDAAEGRLAITARAENHLYGRDDLADTIARLQGFQEAGADVLYAPGLTAAAQIGDIVASVARPVNVLALAGAPSVAELADLGVARVSVGGAFAFAAYGALVDAGREWLGDGTSGWAAQSREARAFLAELFD